MERKYIGAMVIGVGVGAAMVLVPFFFRENQRGKYETQLYDAYETERLAHIQAVAMWKQTENARLAMSKVYESIVAGLDQKVLELQNKPPEIEVQYVEVQVPYEVKVVDRIEVPVYSKPSYFQSVQELQDWVHAWTPSVDGIYQLNSENWNCADSAIKMVCDAALDGKIMGFCVDTIQKHMLASAIIGDQIWFVDPEIKSVFDILNGWRWTAHKAGSTPGYTP